MEGSEKKRLRWVRISPTLSDETVSFRVEGCAGMRLHDFIVTVLSEQSSHCGTFWVKRDEVFTSVSKIEYQDRKVWGMAYYSRDAEQAIDAVVTSARCNGGWGQMNYEVFIENKGGRHAEA